MELLEKRAASFLELTGFSLQRGFHDVATFNAEQAAQLYLKATLLELIGDFPRTHSIISAERAQACGRQGVRGLRQGEQEWPPRLRGRLLDEQVFLQALR
ncbi:MAG: HEPN domain-containing protein [Candidatus Verstraetearchaeota archaeon]|nr:HEPN domain-containing protein [Candidatus Verstraetearchaeota archaeon]